MISIIVKLPTFYTDHKVKFVPGLGLLVFSSEMHFGPLKAWILLYTTNRDRKLTRFRMTFSVFGMTENLMPEE